MELDRIGGGVKPSRVKSLRVMIVLNLFTGIILNSIPGAHVERALALRTARPVEETAPSQGMLARLDTPLLSANSLAAH